MSDFLTNLVMRSFAKPPSVQPMALSTYATPEPQTDPDPVPVEQFVEPVQNTEPVRNTNKHESRMQPVIEASPEVVTAVTPQNDVTAPGDHFENPELREPEPTPESVVQRVNPISIPQTMSRPDQTIAPPAQTTRRISKPAVQVQKVAEPVIVEQVTEHVVERPTFKSIERPTVTTIEHSTSETIVRPSITSIERSIERPTITTIEHSTSETIERPSVTSIERAVEHSTEQSTVTIENTEHLTNAFTTLVPKVTPQSLPALNVKPRPTQSQVAVPDAEQEQTLTASPETVINVAIGRIEVRATPAPTTRRERQQHGPKVMTLDDYLQQRSRGTQ